MPQSRYILKRYGEYSVKLAQLLKEGGRFNAEDLMYLENHMLIVQLAMAMFKIKKPVPIRGE